MSAGGRTARRIPAVLEALREHTDFKVEVAETKAQGHASEIVAEAASQHWDGVFSLGGDGTHNEVLNGFFDESGTARRPGMTLGVLPAGSGGDFARLIYPTRDPVKAAESLKHSSVEIIDVGRCELLEEGVGRCFLNVASLGMGAEVVRRANRGRKLLGGRLTYKLALIKEAFGYAQDPVSLRVDAEAPSTQGVRMIAVANGRFAGGGMNIAPGASIQDGQFDVVVIGKMSGMATVFHSTKLHKGTHLALPQVEVYQGVDVHAELGADAKGPVYVELDGEEIGHLPARFHMLPQSLPFLMPQSSIDD
jgi:YegS/Rv2252/BmrU family lipid kinase